MAVKVQSVIRLKMAGQAHKINSQSDKKFLSWKDEIGTITGHIASDKTIWVSLRNKGRMQ
jgi:hypothetical protein